MSNAVYSADKPADCAYCYFWREERKKAVNCPHAIT